MDSIAGEVAERQQFDNTTTQAHYSHHATSQPRATQVGLQIGHDKTVTIDPK